MANEKWVADARELLIEIERIYDDHYSRSYDQCVHDIFNAMRRIVRRNAKFRTVEVVHGRWERVIPTKSAAKWSTKVSCSVCHKQGYDYHNYCPNCGAKMDGDGNG